MNTPNTVSKLELEIEQIKERNEIRLQEAKTKLGSKWLLHPANAVKRKLNEKENNATTKN